ncbi:MAG TPA: response regulator, partial [Acidimicrobiia bacterium]|nr:response regulator [Acidimicrobiia bacterium]
SAPRPTARGWNAPPSRSGPTSLSSTCDSATGFNGLTVARRLKSADDFPLLFLTSASSIEDVLAAFDAGGDDYIVKPFVMAELLARMRAALRRNDRAT